MSDQQRYKSYLLRLWQTHSRGGTVWRASLEDPHTGIRLGFSSIRRLHEFLLGQTDDAQNLGDTRLADSSSSPGWHDDSP